MGLWGKFSSLFSGPPSADTPKPYTEDPYMGEGGPGRERAFGADVLGGGRFHWCQLLLT